MESIRRWSTTIAIIFALLLGICKGFCSTSYTTLGIKNGDYYLRSSNTVVQYACDRGFFMYGNSHIVCFHDTWSDDPPKCLTNTCQKIVATKTLRVKEAYNGSLVKFSCSVGHELSGAKMVTCDGESWSHPIPKCESSPPDSYCNFERESICGYTHHDDGDVEWRRHTGSTKTSRTGPSHDHTFGDRGQGHYMYFETSSPTRKDHRAILASPLYYKQNSHLACVTFWYHILGVGDMGRLDVYIKPESRNVTLLKPIFTVDTNMGAEWVSQRTPVPVVYEPFQIVFIATRGSSYRSDIAIDDVDLHTCTDDGFTSTKKAASAKVTVSKTPATVGSTRVVTQTTSKQTTVPATTTRTTTVTTTTSKAPATTARPTSATQQYTSSTKAPQSSTASVLVSTELSSRKVLTKRITNASISAKTSKPTMTPRINYNIPTKNPAAIRQDESEGVNTKVVYIMVGIVAVALVAGAVVLSLYLYRRYSIKKKKARLGPGTVNPLYNAVDNEEALISFVIDSEYEHM